MTAARKVSCKNASITVAISSTQTLITGAKKISVPDDGMDLWDATSLDNTDEVMAASGFLSPGKVTFDLFFDSKDSVHQYLMAAKYSKTLEAFVITGPDQVNASSTQVGDKYTFTFSGYITKFTLSSEVKKGQEASVEISLASVATFVPG